MLKKFLCYLLCATSLSLFSVNAFATNDTNHVNDPQVASYIAEKTAEIEQTVEAVMELEDGTIYRLSPEVKLERVGDLPTNARNASPEDGIYRVSVYASSSKDDVAENSTLNASLTLVAYYTTSGLEVTTTKQHYSYSGSTKASVVSRSLGVYGDGNGIKKTPTSDSGSYSIVKSGIINRPFVDAIWSLKNKTSGAKSSLTCRVNL